MNRTQGQAEQQAQIRAKAASQKPISKKRKFVKDGVFFAELNDVLAHEFADNGYAGCDVRVTPKCTEVYIRATHTREVSGENNKRIREMTALIQHRFKFEPGKIRLFTAAVQNKGLSALAQAQAVKYRLLQGLSVRLAAYSVVKLIMERGAKGCEVVVSGKLRGQRAKAMKFRDGYMIHAGDATNYYVEKAVKHVHLRQGVIGIKVKIMLPHDPTGVAGVKRDLPDTVQIQEPKVEEKEEATANVASNMELANVGNAQTVEQQIQSQAQQLLQMEEHMGLTTDANANADNGDNADNADNDPNNNNNNLLNDGNVDPNANANMMQDPQQAVQQNLNQQSFNNNNFNAGGGGGGQFP